jgi:hypothetical protein
MNQAVSSMNPWVCVLLIASAGSVGGLLNTYMSDNGFALPRRIGGVWCPGALWNVFVGGISALTSWALYGSGAGIDLASPREQISLRLGALAGALIVGMAGSKWLTNEVDKNLLRQGVMHAAKKHFSPQKYQELEQCDSPKQVLETVVSAEPSGHPAFVSSH